MTIDEDRIREIIQEELKSAGLIPGIEDDYHFHKVCSICGKELVQNYDREGKVTKTITHESIAECLESLIERLRQI